MWTIKAQFLNCIIWYAVVFLAVPSQGMLLHTGLCNSPFALNFKVQNEKKWSLGGLIVSFSCIGEVLAPASILINLPRYLSTNKEAGTDK